MSPWVEPGSVYNEEYRHTSLIATPRKRWGLGDTFTQRADLPPRLIVRVLRQIAGHFFPLLTGLSE